MADRLNISTFDRLNKPTSMKIPCAAGTSQAEAIAVADAIEAVILGVAPGAVQTSRTVHQAATAGPSADTAANRGNKLLMKVSVPLDKGGQGDIYDYEIGTFDDSVLPDASSDFLPVNAGLGLAIKTAVEAVFESDEGNPGVVQSLQQVNRNLN